jgi:hypothetical protein
MMRLKRLLFFCACVLAIPCGLFAQTIVEKMAARADSSEFIAAKNTPIAELPSAPVPLDRQSQSNSEQQQTTSQGQQQTPPAQPPSSSPQSQQEPSLGDLGISASQTQGSARQQALLDKRTHMLKVHQTLGLITLAPMVATLITGPQAKAKGKNGGTITEPTDANLDFHIALGGLTTGMYFATAYYAAFAPREPGVKKRGAIRTHEWLIWIHGPGMVLTPVLGIMAYKQENAGEKVHGIASAHGTVADITTAAYAASIIAVSWPIHIKF